MIKLIVPINIGPYGGDEDYRCCQSAATSKVSGFGILAAGDLASRERHGFGTGDEVILDSLIGGAGLTATTHYFVHVIDGTDFKLCANGVDADAGTAVNVTTDATGVTVTRVVVNPFYGITSRRRETDNCVNSESQPGGMNTDLEIAHYLDGSQVTGAEFGASTRFGVCCEYDLTIDLSGNVRAVFTGRDAIEIFLNEVSVYSRASDATEGYEWWRDNMGVDPVTNEHALYPITDSVTIPMSGAACGDVIEIRTTSGAVHATEAEFTGLGWTATINR